MIRLSNRVSMTGAVAVVLTAVFAVSGIGCGSSDQQAPASMLPASLKGYELYSWKSQSVGEDWCFTLITGTNRSKQRSEIGPPDQIEAAGLVKLTVCDPTLLERALARLRGGEFVFWSAGDFVENDAPKLPPIAFPGAEVIEQIRARSAALGIDLHIDR